MDSNVLLSIGLIGIGLWTGFSSYRAFEGALRKEGGVAKSIPAVLSIPISSTVFLMPIMIGAEGYLWSACYVFGGLAAHATRRRCPLQ